ncbi:MAG: hypothetical protein R2873_36180 [Caldilineaceae bacterium]
MWPRLSILLGIAISLAFWLRVGATPMTQTSVVDPTQQNSNVPTPTTAPPDTPTTPPQDTPTTAPPAVTDAPAQVTPTSAPIDTQPPRPQDTPTAEVGVAPDVAATPDVSPTALLLLPPVDRDIAPPPAEEPLNFGTVVDDVLRSMADVAVWLWFVCGSLIFFVVAGIIGGIYFGQRERQRYDLYTLEPDDHDHFHDHFEVEQQETRRPSPPDDDVWPASLP